jgi:hypothetical protein
MLPTLISENTVVELVGCIVLGRILMMIEFISYLMDEYL